MAEQWLPPIYWDCDAVAILDQRILPHQEKTLRCTTPDHVINAIKTMAIRGAPAVGVAGALALALGPKSIKAKDLREFKRKFSHLCQKVKEARPTGANLGWAVERIYSVVVENTKADITELQELILREANAILSEDYRSQPADRKMGPRGSPQGGTDPYLL